MNPVLSTNNCLTPKNYIKMEKRIFVTFIVKHLGFDDEKFAVVCETNEQANAVYADAKSLVSIKNVGLRLCQTPKNHNVMAYHNYWEYDEWL